MTFTFPRFWKKRLMYGTKDTITVDLPANTAIVFASVEAEKSCMLQYGYVRFIGSDGTLESSCVETGEYLFEVSSSQIGTIQAIEVYDKQGIFSTVTIGVVPEPGSVLLLVSGITIVLVLRRMPRPFHPANRLGEM